MHFSQLLVVRTVHNFRSKFLPQKRVNFDVFITMADILLSEHTVSPAAEVVLPHTYTPRGARLETA